MLKNLLSLSFVVLSLTFCHSQELNDQFMGAMNMRSIGPAGMSGRVTAITVETENPEVIYVGTASGGVWKSKSGGISWEPGSTTFGSITKNIRNWIN
jgi:uncharacterized secreted protein with C-terminal beta-propeller domain